MDSRERSGPEEPRLPDREVVAHKREVVAHKQEVVAHKREVVAHKREVERAGRAPAAEEMRARAEERPRQRAPQEPHGSSLPAAPYRRHHPA